MTEPLSEQQAKKLLARAEAALSHSVCPLSEFAVATALLCEDGAVVTGVNVESKSLLQSGSCL